MILPILAVDSVHDAVKEAFRALRQGDLPALGASMLADTPLVRTCLLREPALPPERALVLQAMLRWATDRLQPGGTRDWQDRRWLDYNLLQAYYWEGHSIADLAEWSGYSDMHVTQSLRPRALTNVTQILYEEFVHPRDLAGRQQYVAAALYERLPEVARTALICVAALPGAVSLDLLYRLVGHTELASALQQLLSLQMLHTADDAQHVVVHPLLRPFARLQTPPDHRRDWLVAAARWYVEHGEPGTAVACYAAAQHFEQGAAVLRETWKAIVDRADLQAIDQLRTNLAVYVQSRLPQSVRCELARIAGQVAEFRGDLDQAYASYEQALAAPDAAIRGFALYRLAELSKRRHTMALALAYYQRAIQTLDDAPDQTVLLARLCIDRAMIYIQEQPDLEQAVSDLRRADQLVPASEQALNSDLHNAWASYCYQRRDHEAELHHRLQAWLYAVETHDRERMLKTAHNLGQAYAWRQQFDEALRHLERSQELARQTGNQQLFGAGCKTIGNIYFWQARYDLAEAEYRAAYTLFREIGNRNWQGYLCYELAELYATRQRWTAARAYCAEGRNLAESLQNRKLADAFDELAQQFPLTTAVLNERQQQAVAYLLEHGQITNKDYCDLAQCSPVTAARDLKDGVDQGVFTRVGQGRGTAYQLARTA